MPKRKRKSTMKKNYLRTLVFVTVVLLIISIQIGDVFNSSSVYAKQLRKGKREVRQKWEYCAIVDIGFISKGEKYSGFSKICYFQNSGCKEQTVESTGMEESSAKANAFAIAIANLGNEGWEMIGEGSSLVSWTNVHGSLYFKRRKP